MFRRKRKSVIDKCNATKCPNCGNSLFFAFMPNQTLLYCINNPNCKKRYTTTSCKDEKFLRKITEVKAQKIIFSSMAMR